MTTHEGFHPDWVSPPGDTIVDILSEQHVSILEFAQHLGCSIAEVTSLLEGHTPITLSLARRLQDSLGPSLEFWMSRDYHYRHDLSRLHTVHQAWLRELPINDMATFGWIKPFPDPSDQLQACLRFFDVPSLRAWHYRYDDLQHLLPFRTSPSFPSRPASIAAWLRQGEIETEKLSCKTWNPEHFYHSLSHIRSLTRQKDPRKFIPQLQHSCSVNGVAVVIIRSPDGCRASGAVRFLSPTKALIQLSFRYLTDDHFWFTFFHEAGHLLLHTQRILFSESEARQRSCILEGPDMFPTPEEEKANEFAARILIPPDFKKELSQLPAEVRTVIRFARTIGVSPGAVVGQMQYLRRIRYNQLNSLKRRFTWED